MGYLAAVAIAMGSGVVIGVMVTYERMTRSRRPARRFVRLCPPNFECVVCADEQREWEAERGWKARWFRWLTRS